MGRLLALLAVVAAWLVVPAAAFGATGQLVNCADPVNFKGCTFQYTADGGETNGAVLNTSTASGQTFEIADAGASRMDATPPCFAPTASTMDCPQDDVTSFAASLGDGNDSIVINANLPSSIGGGGGNDSITGSPVNDQLQGNNGNDAMDGGGGNDQLYGDTPDGSGTGGDDTLRGGQGNDTLFGGQGNDTFPAESGPDGTDEDFGGPGIDTATFAARDQPVQLSLDDVANDGVKTNATDNIHTDVENLVGGSASDVLTGDGDTNGLDGGPGDDTEHGGGGDDNLTGDNGNDVLAGGEGADSLDGGADNDTLDGGAGPDVLAGGDGTDLGDYANRSGPLTITLDGQPGDGEPGEGDNVEPDVENLRGGAGNDTFIGSAAANVLDGGGGENYEDGGTGADSLIGGPAGDVLRTRSASEGATVNCGAGPDFVIAKPADLVSADCDRVDRGVNQKPKLHDSTVVAPAAGGLQMSPAGITRSVPLQDKVVLPLRSVVDTTFGAVKITSAQTSKKTQAITMSEGAFQITQTAAKLAITQFALVGGDFGSCTAARRAGTAHAASSAKVVRHLWASGRGKFRTRGRYAAASVRGTRWLTQDRCDGTRVKVQSGAVSVQDLVKRITRLVKAPKSYFAAAKGK